MVTTYTLADPLSVATQGFQNSFGTLDTLGISTVGWIIIEEEIIEPPVEPEAPQGDGGGTDPYGDEIWNPWAHLEDKKKKKKKITVKAEVEGKVYTQSVTTDDLTLDVKDVNIQIVKELNEIKINIILPEES